MSEWSGGQAGYIRVADNLRARIESGLLRPGDKLPSVSALVNEFDVVGTTVQKAIRTLKAAGLVESRPGKGLYVRTRKRKISRSADYISPLRPGEKLPHSKTDRLEVVEVVPSDEIAELLGLEPGVATVRRSRVMLDEEDDETPIETAASYFPLEIARGTELAAPAKLKGATPTVLARLGLPPRYCREWIEARMPTAAETEILRLPPGTPVIRLLRVVFTDGDRPVEVLDMSLGADTFTMEYELRVRNET